jgi:hypothetical protein
MGQCANPKMLFELQNMYRTQENQEMFTELVYYSLYGQNVISSGLCLPSNTPCFLQVSIFDKGSSSMRGTHMNFSPMFNNADASGTGICVSQVGLK